MLSSDDLTQTTDELVTGELETGALEQLPRILDRKSFVSERRQSILQQKHMEAVSPLTTDTPNAKVAWRQVGQLREENRRLRFELEDVQKELQQLTADYKALQFESEASVIPGGQQQEIKHSHDDLLAVMEERDRLKETLQQLELRYQDLYHSFQDAAEEEAQKMVAEATHTLELPSEDRPALLQDMVETVETQVRRTESKHLLEALYLKREVQKILDQMQQKNRAFDQELKNLLSMQQTAREQAKMRQKVLHSRLHARWTVKSVSTTLGVLFLLVILQFLCLNLFHVQVVAALSLSLITPIVLCVILAIVLATPINMIKHVYTGAPHKKRVKEDS